VRGPATVLVCLALGCATTPERPAAATAAPGGSAPDAGAGPAALPSGTPAAFGEVDALLAQSLPTWGGGVLRVEQDNKVIFERAYGGYAPADAVPIASATKLLSTLVILTLVRDGFLTLDTPAGSLLPSWPKDKAAITLRMLLAQTSGLPARSDCLETRLGTLDACTQEIARLPLRAPPGKAFIDGGAGFQVAGRMAELADQSGGVPLQQSAFALAPGRESLRAGFGVYRDRLGSDGRALEVVSQGVFGFTGWVDTERRLVGVLVVRGKVAEVWPVEQRVRELVRKAVPVAGR